MENWEIEKSKYTRTLKTVINGISNILDMNGCPVIDKTLREKLTGWKADSEKLLQKLTNDEFEIAIIGLEKAGKSSFSNALIENNLLPTDDQRCTYTSTCIMYNETDSAEIIFYTKEEFAQDFSDKLGKMGIENAGDYSFELLEKEQYNQLFQDLSPENQKLYGNTLNMDIKKALDNKQSIIKYLGRPPKQFGGKVLASKNFRGFITDPSRAIAVKEITIGSKLLEKMSNAIIYDVPGFNSPTEMHKQQTRAKMKSADVIILVAKADEPSLTEEVLDVFHECDNDGTVLNDKLFIFANKIDRTVHTSEDIQATYKQWIDERNILEEKHRDRIFFGSSNAHLQAAGKLSPYDKSDYIGALKVRGLDNDGIDAIRTALEEYNHTERFEVLKGRINKIKNTLSEAFGEISQKYQPDNKDNSVTEDKIDLALSFRTEFINKAVKNLQSYRDDVVRGQMQKDRPISKDIAKYISETIVIDNYQITEQELEKAHKDNISSITGHEAPQTVEPPLRKEKFEIMYHDFSDAIMSISVSSHIKCHNDIINMVMEAMGLSEASPYYNDIRAKICREFSDKTSRGTDEDYYQSLIERFSRDIYEILIQCTYSEDRYNKFEQEMDNFFSLSVFYNPGLTEENKLDYINKAPKDQKLCNLLLFHDKHNTTGDLETSPQKTEELARRIKDITGLEDISSKNMKLIKTIVDMDYDNADKIITDVLGSSVYNGENQMTISAKTSMLLQKAINEMQESGKGSGSNIIQADISKPDEFRKAYANYFAEIRTSHTYEDVRKDFACDIEILRNVLLNAFIRAINIEKSFVAREVKFIEYVISWIESRDFNSFISKNIMLIKSEEFGHLKHAEAEIKMTTAFISEINKIIATINQVQ